MDTAKKGQYNRLGSFSLEEVLPHVIFDCKYHGERGKAQRVPFGEFQVNMASARYQCFVEHGTDCSECGIKGSFFALEVDKSHKEGTQPHFNLYAIDSDGNEVLMTKDHVIPLSKGGKNNLSNFKTMCCHCNEKKADKLIESVEFSQ